MYIRPKVLLSVAYPYFSHSPVGHKARHRMVLPLGPSSHVLHSVLDQFKFQPVEIRYFKVTGSNQFYRQNGRCLKMSPSEMILVNICQCYEATQMIAHTTHRLKSDGSSKPKYELGLSGNGNSTREHRKITLFGHFCLKILLQGDFNTFIRFSYVPQAINSCWNPVFINDNLISSFNKYLRVQDVPR